MGDISSQLKIRKDLECKPFKWFMETVAFDLVKYYPPIPIPPYANGLIRNSALGFCIEIYGGKLVLENCKTKSNYGQMFEWTFHSDLRPHRQQQCFDVSNSDIGGSVGLFSCHGMKGNQEFKYDLVSACFIFKKKGQNNQIS